MRYLILAVILAAACSGDEGGPSCGDGTYILEFTHIAGNCGGLDDMPLVVAGGQITEVGHSAPEVASLRACVIHLAPWYDDQDGLRLDGNLAGTMSARLRSFGCQSDYDVTAVKAD